VDGPGGSLNAPPGLIQNKTTFYKVFKMKYPQTVKRVLALTPSTAAVTVTAAGVGIDCKDADYATFEVICGLAANTNAAPVVVKIQESDTDVASNYADVNTNTLQASVALSTASAQVAAFHVNLNGTRKRYLRVFGTPGTHTTNSVVQLAAVANLVVDQLPAGTAGQADVVAIG
jgi:hypothetical protein